MTGLASVPLTSMSALPVKSAMLLRTASVFGASEMEAQATRSCQLRGDDRRDAAARQHDVQNRLLEIEVLEVERAFDPGVALERSPDPSRR